MVEYTTTILKFNDMGEKTGWTYIEIPPDVAEQLKSGVKKSFRVKGKLDDYPIEKVAVMPMGKGSFILAINSSMRKGIGKREGAMLKVQLEEDNRELILNHEMMQCLNEESEAITNFNKLAKSHQHYFSKWVESAKTDETKTKRIALTVNAMVKGLSYGEMIRAQKNNKI